ncbi:SOS response-associated peptidase [Dactylosporangium sp. AC04546]|uniref:SOS response-associated peptidase n=1 Tax=Dactylosporangium sp. AC04546 TaxID=2862460 RepID=UPI001EE01F85|nr:SOS response-associated peptidase [Dactylosporangium sp. AC04546]WVK84882.1 SOS response-associated peptidase [Dactylosporangium sp. AC04546]
MCGRYATSRSSVDLSALFEAADETDGLEPDYNVAPTDPVPMVRVSSSAGGRVLSSARWGLVPSWAKDPKAGARMINARAETVTTSNAFAQSFARRRCLVPADGWFEWVRDGKAKQAYFMTLGDAEPCVFAGIWTVWGQGDDRLLTCSIVTAPAVDDLALVHDRMPLLLPPDRWDAWLSAPADDELLAPTPSSHVARLELRPVGARVGDVRNDGPDLLDRVPAPSLRPNEVEPIDLTLF